MTIRATVHSARGVRPAFIRAAALVALIQGLGHGSLVLLATPHHGPEESRVVETMKAHAFNFSGAVRTYWDLYVGYALLAAGTCLIEAALLWQLAPLARTDPNRLRWLIGLVILANIAHGLLVLRFFFYLPLALDLAIIVLLLIALQRVAQPAA